MPHPRADPIKVEPEKPYRGGATEVMYILGMALLFVGLWISYSFGLALIVLGGIISGVSVATSFLVTWLAADSAGSGDPRRTTRSKDAA